MFVKQVVIGGRNKYLINGSNANNNRVQDLFRSVQLNVNNPHFLIMQGRITKVLNMKPPEVVFLFYFLVSQCLLHLILMSFHLSRPCHCSVFFDSSFLLSSVDFQNYCYFLLTSVNTAREFWIMLQDLSLIHGNWSDDHCNRSDKWPSGLLLTRVQLPNTLPPPPQPPSLPS